MLSRCWFSIGDLARMELPGMPKTHRGLQLMGMRENWFVAHAEGVSWRPRKGRGGGKEVHYSRLPPVALMALLIRAECPPQCRDAKAC